MIGIVIREMPYLKILDPIMNELHVRGQKYVLYFMDSHKGEKEYARPTIKRLIKSSEKSVLGASKTKSFSNDWQLLNQFAHDKITKVVSVEVWMWAKGYLKELKRRNIKTYSILYLSDSLWQPNPHCIQDVDYTYYASDYIRKVQHDFLGMPINENKTKFIGSPIFDPLINAPSNGNNILVLLPNLRMEHVHSAFGNKDNFIKIISKLSTAGNLIFKARKKQWFPTEIKKYSNNIVEDGEKMYPPEIASLLQQSYTTVMFFSSGIYECVYGGNYIVNIPLPLNRWGWDTKKMKQYFDVKSENLYQFDGVVESITQQTILSPQWAFKPRRVDIERRKLWIDHFIGLNPADGVKSIVNDIINN
jgi:hypothetical protein